MSIVVPKTPNMCRELARVATIPSSGNKQNHLSKVSFDCFKLYSKF